MRFELVEIPDWEPAEHDVHLVRALWCGERSPALQALRDWKRSAPKDYKKIMRALSHAATTKRPTNGKLVVRDKAGRDIYELRAQGGNARLFYFYFEGAEEIIVCANEYWKSKPSSVEQERAFDRCASLRENYREYTKASGK